MITSCVIDAQCNNSISYNDFYTSPNHQELIEGQTLICVFNLKKDKDTGELKTAKLFYGNILKDMPYPISHKDTLYIDEYQYQNILNQYLKTKKVVTI